MSRPLGALRDPPGQTRGIPISGLVGARRIGLPQVVDMRARVARIVDQVDQGCVGHALGQCIRVVGSILGIALDVSDSAIYALARELENPRVSVLSDVGSYPSKAVDALAIYGVCSRERWGDDAGAHLRVTEDVLESGALATVDGTYHIASDEYARCADIMAALSAGHPVMFAMNVDFSYEEYAGGIWEGMSGPSLGGHAQCLIGYDADSVLVANSWGRGWGENGFSRIAWPWVMGPQCHDFYVVTIAPKGVQ